MVYLIVEKYIFVQSKPAFRDTFLLDFCCSIKLQIKRRGGKTKNTERIKWRGKEKAKSVRVIFGSNLLLLIFPDKQKNVQFRNCLRCSDCPQLFGN